MHKNEYLAKSNGETIIEHTQNLLDNLSILRSFYKDDLFVEEEILWNALFDVCRCHDLGKMGPKFQKKLHGPYDPSEIPHGVLSTAFIATKEWKNVYGKNLTIAMVHAIAYHHERKLEQFAQTDLKNEIELLKREIENFDFAALKLSQRNGVKAVSGRYFDLDDGRLLEEDNPEAFRYFVLLKGLLNRLDYAASGYYKVELANDFLSDSMAGLLKDWQKGNIGSNWNELQRYMLNHQEENVVVIAQTGMGKTEAGLLWLGNRKGFFTLPLKSAINAIYQRIITSIVKENQQTRVGMLHSDTYAHYLKGVEGHSFDWEVEEYFQRTKGLSMPLTICTLDQLFDFVFKYAGSEMKIATLSYSKVIIDEIQMYSSDLLSYLILGLRTIQSYGGKFAVLTATLPSFLLELMRKQGIEFTQPDHPFVDDSFVRHSLSICQEPINIKQIKEQYKENKILVICNTVRKAVEIFDQLSEHFGQDVHLLHSRFIKKDRAKKETAIFQMGQRTSSESGIWVTTQIVEASLDIDFDLLFTELSDLNGLFQRMGRCYRKRALSMSAYPNCYVYTGGDGVCSGVGPIIDPFIFELSKQALCQLGNGVLTESEKAELIGENYTSKKLKDSAYYENIVQNIAYMDALYDFEFEKKEVQQIFRNIQNITSIPKCVYEENHLIIEENKGILAKKINSKMTDSEKKELKRAKTNARTVLASYSVDLPLRELNEKQLERQMLNKYETLNILSCDYDERRGVQLKKYKEKDELTEVEIEDNFF
ncbi:CRISPR-associated helicase Cas3' [Candidatus Enterococcus clewellii]|uniref:CRISPR-associated helicase cas3 n=2 Tax=Candidatus Enterococcus clewellii TaxID=1834193 RepID=A0AAQ3VWX6_9ENTE